MPDPKFSGGSVTLQGDYYVHVFESSGTFEKLVTGPVTVDVAVVGGGGGSTGGAQGNRGGGGGAGGVLVSMGVVVSGNVSVVVGAGGLKSNTFSVVADDGEDSEFGELVATGGGAGGSNADSSPGNGGSGGGSGGSTVASTVAGGSGTEGQGEDGGAGHGSSTTSVRGGGGGGGADQAGGNASSGTGGTGGDGVDLSSLFGTLIGNDGWVGGGGGGGGNTPGSAGQGGGGAGGFGTTPGGDGDANTGGGAGGPGGNGTNGSDGGSGVVVVRYLAEDAVPPPPLPEPEEEEHWIRESRRFQADFETPAHCVDGLSTVRRPDAISADYLLATSPGPIALNDPSAGTWARTWKAWVDNDSGEVWIAGAALEGMGWAPETLLFSFTVDGDPILELDLAFDQNGSPILVAQRGGNLWIHFFDPTADEGQGANVFEDFGPGRTPRVVLDDPRDTVSSDVVALYLVDDDLKWRAQRDRYADEYGTTLDPQEHRFLERAYRNGNRVQVIQSVRDPETGAYTLEVLSTTLFPYRANPEPFGPAPPAFLDGQLTEVVQVAPDADLEVVEPGVLFLVGGVLVEPVIGYEMDDEFAVGMELAGATVVNVVVEGEAEEEEFEVAAALAGGDLAAVVIVRDAATEEFEPLPIVLAGGLLEVP
jgi:hypothetical protein